MFFSSFENVFIIQWTIHNTETTASPAQVWPSAEGQILKVRLKLWKKVNNTSRLKWGQDCNVEKTLKKCQDFQHCFEVIFESWNNVRFLTIKECCIKVEAMSFQPKNNIVSMLKQHHSNQETTLKQCCSNIETTLFQCWNNVIPTWKQYCFNVGILTLFQLSKTTTIQHCFNVVIWCCFNIDPMSFCRLGEGDSGEHRHTQIKAESTHDWKKLNNSHLLRCEMPTRVNEVFLPCFTWVGCHSSMLLVLLQNHVVACGRRRIDRNR